MAYFNQEMKKAKAPAIKAICKKYGIKATMGVEHHSTFIVNIKSGIIDFDDDNSRHSVNPYSYDRDFTGIALEFLTELIDAMMDGNHNNNNAMIDYFDVGFYITVNIGKWDTPYKLIK